MELWFDPDTGTKVKKGRGWQVILNGEALSLLADNGRGQHVLIGSATWTGKGLAKRYAVDQPIEQSTWGKLEHALRTATGEPAPAPAPPPVATDLRFVVSTSTGDVIARGPAASPQGQFEWLVTVDGSEVAITDSAGAPVATAIWTGLELADRPEAIEERVWKLVEQAMRLAIADPGTAVAVDDEPAADVSFGLVVDLATRRQANQAAARTAFEWNVFVEAGSVRVEDAARTLLGTAIWTGKRLERRKTERTINDFQWDVVEDVLIEKVTGSPAPARPDTRVPLPAADVRQPPTEPERDRRSGWWALGAFLLALAGFIVSLLAYRKGDSISLVTTIVLGALALGLGIYTAFGAGTRCPRCKAWYRRQTTSVENLGSHTEQRQKSTPVYDSSGKQTGTTSQTVTVTVTKYRYNYRCKECSNTWTGYGTSESGG